MTDNIHKSNMYSLRETPWHKKGIVGQEEEGAVSVFGKMDDIRFELRPFSIDLNGGHYSTNKHFGIVRIGDKNEKVVGQTKGRYLLTQPITYAQLFDEYVGKPVETLGFLGTSGERMFLVWNLPNIDVHGDIVKAYGFLAVGFDGVYGEKLLETRIRVVCQNTWSQAVHDTQSKGTVYSGRHNQLNHEKTLGIWMRYVANQADENIAIFQGLYRKMEETPISIDKAYGLFSQVYPLKDSLGAYHPDELRSKNQKTIDDKNEGAMEKRDLAMSLFLGAGIGITPTVWGAFNSITELENHRVPSKKDTTDSILIGNRQKIMQDAFVVMRSYVESVK